MNYRNKKDSSFDLVYGFVVVAMFAVMVVGAGTSLVGSKKDPLTLAMQARFATPVAQQVASSNHSTDEVRS